MWGRSWAGSAWDDDPAKADWRLNPLYGEVVGLRDVHVYVGTREIFYPEVRSFAQRLEDADVATELVVGQGPNHVWPLHPTPEAARAQEEIAAPVAA